MAMDRTKAWGKLKHRYLFAAGYESGSKKIQRGREGRPVPIDEREVYDAGFDAAEEGKRQSEAYREFLETERQQQEIRDLQDAVPDPETGDYDEAIHDHSDVDEADLDYGDIDYADFDDAEDDVADQDEADQDDADLDPAYDEADYDEADYQQ